jgi:hypothetical protein
MPIDIQKHQISDMITWFNSFVGFSELWSRIERVETKLRAVDFTSPVLNRRYMFHLNYKRIVRRNRMFQKIELSDFDNYQAISFIAAVRDASRHLSEQAKARLRAKILDGLSPDRDIRELEHEFRVYIHYRQQRCEVHFADLEGAGNYDFDVKKGDVCFEVEAKTLSEDIGNLVSVEDSIMFFEGFKIALAKSPSFQESGIITFNLLERPDLSTLTKNVAAITADFLEAGIAERTYKAMRIAFQRKSDWETLIRQQNFGPIRQEMTQKHESLNPHAMIILGRGQALMFCVVGNRPTRMFKGVMRRLKKASSQLSGEKPGLIWMHFLGLDETEFTSLRADHAAGRNNAFAAFGRYLFDSVNRNHICRVRFSAESDQIRRNGYRTLLENRTELQNHGPAYDLISNVSRFDANIVM